MPDKLPEQSPKDDDLLANAIPIEEEAEPVADEDGRIELAEEDAAAPTQEIRSFAKARAHVQEWRRAPLKTGQGATHMKTFYAKLRADAIEYLDQQLNDWLDANPGYEVKIVTSSIGVLTGKTNEPAMFLTVWV